MPAACPCWQPTPCQLALPACLCATLSPLLPKAAGCGFFISFRCFFSFQGFVLPCLSHGGGGALVSQALLTRGEPDMAGLGGRAMCLVGAGCFLGVFWVFSGCLIPGSAREHQTRPANTGWSDPHWPSSSHRDRASVRGSCGFESIWVV